jgi:hypothetical protein
MAYRTSLNTRFGREGLRVAMRDLFDVHEGWVFEIPALLGSKKFLHAVHNGALQSGAVCSPLQIEAIPLADHASNCRRIVVAVKERKGSAPEGDRVGRRSRKLLPLWDDA